MIYDSASSRSMFFWREDGASGYDDCISEITDSRIAFGGRKMYPSVCQDREPNTDIRW